MTPTQTVTEPSDELTKLFKDTQEGDVVTGTPNIGQLIRGTLGLRA